MSERFYDSTGRLPDALAFVSPGRARLWIKLHEAGGPLSASEIAEIVDASQATVYRMINEFQELGLVRETVYIGSHGPTNRYEFVHGGRSE